MHWIAVALLLTGCELYFAGEADQDAPDAGAASTTAWSCLGSGYLQLCLPTPTIDTTITSELVVDTDKSCDAVSDGACLWIRRTLRVDERGALVGIGSRPL